MNGRRSSEYESTSVRERPVEAAAGGRVDSALRNRDRKAIRPTPKLWERPDASHRTPSGRHPIIASEVGLGCNLREDLMSLLHNHNAAQDQDRRRGVQNGAVRPTPHGIRVDAASATHVHPKGAMPSARILLVVLCCVALCGGCATRAVTTSVPTTTNCSQPSLTPIQTPARQQDGDITITVAPESPICEPLVRISYTQQNRRRLTASGS